MKNPIRTTIVYALASGAIVVPAAMLLSTYLYWPTAIKLVLWADLVLYGVLMARWSGARMLSVFFPLAILLGAALWPKAYIGFFILALGVFSWIRSGLCFQATPLRALMAEVITMIGAAAVLVFLDGHSPVAWALNICLFFLIQSLYFFIVPVHRASPDFQNAKDPFERAAEQAKKVLDGI
jgi:hypothetical protein